MNKILVVGAGPLPDQDGTLTCSYNLRTAKIAWWLSTKGIPFDLVAINLFTEARNGPVERCPSLVGEYESLSKGSPGRDRLREIVSETRPRAILAISYEPAAMVCELDPPCPVWADMPGWIMAEAQLKCTLSSSDEYVAHYGSREQTVLRRADRISVVSHNQRHATLGELAVLGRLNRRNAGYPLVQVLPSIAIDWRPLLTSRAGPEDSASTSAIPNDARILLWSGSYNLWTDPSLIFNLVSELMERFPDLHYVSTGGCVPRYNEEIYQPFSDMVRASINSHRFHLLPWLRFGEALSWFDRATLGLCIDSRNIEVAYGSRTRVVDMLAHGLAVAATTGTELVDDLKQSGATVALDPGRPETWADHIEPVLRSDEHLRAYAAKGHQVIHNEYSLDAVGHELLDWLRHPDPAPDNAFRARITPFIDLNRKAQTSQERRSLVDQQPLVTWQPQAQIEAMARRVVDSHPASPKSMALQSAASKMLNNRLMGLPTLGIWWGASKLLPSQTTVRWQSRFDVWLADRSIFRRRHALNRRIGRGVYGRALQGVNHDQVDKAVNILVARHEYDQEGDLLCLPQRIEIETSSSCNIRCRMCKIPYVEKPGLLLDRRVFDRLKPYLRHVSTLEFVGEGEPTLHPDFGEFLEIAASQACHVRIFTNGTRLTPELSAQILETRVGIMVVSIYGGDAESYRRVTGSDRLRSVIENVANFQDIKRMSGNALPKLHMTCPLIADSLESAPDLVRLASSLGFECVSLGIAYIFLHEMESQSLMSVEPAKVNRVFEQCDALGKELGIQVLLPAYGNRVGSQADGQFAQNVFGCLFPWHSITIRADGIAEICAYNRKIVGDLNRESLREIWNGEQYRRFRLGQVRHGDINYCDTCYFRAYREGDTKRKVLLPHKISRYGYE